MEEGEEEMDMEKRSQGTKGEYGGGGRGTEKGEKVNGTEFSPYISKISGR